MLVFNIYLNLWNLGRTFKWHFRLTWLDRIADEPNEINVDYLLSTRPRFSRLWYIVNTSISAMMHEDFLFYMFMFFIRLHNIMNVLDETLTIRKTLVTCSIETSPKIMHSLVDYKQFSIREHNGANLPSN